MVQLEDNWGILVEAKDNSHQRSPVEVLKNCKAKQQTISVETNKKSNRWLWRVGELVLRS